VIIGFVLQLAGIAKLKRPVAQAGRARGAGAGAGVDPDDPEGGAGGPDPGGPGVPEDADLIGGGTVDDGGPTLGAAVVVIVTGGTAICPVDDPVSGKGFIGRDPCVTEAGGGGVPLENIFDNPGNPENQDVEAGGVEAEAEAEAEAGGVEAEEAA